MFAIFIYPPDDACETDEDSGREDNVEMDNLPKSYLLAGANLAEIEPNVENNDEAKV